MDKKELIQKYARTDDDSLFLARFLDKVSQADKGYFVCSHFMDPHQRSIAKKVLNEVKAIALFDGGYSLAERVVCFFVPDYLKSAIKPEEDAGSRRVLIDEGLYPISLLQVNYAMNKYTQPLTHRDYLGALMNLGIKREMLGDILVHKEYGQIIVLNELVEFIKMNLGKIANMTVVTIDKDFSSLVKPDTQVEAIQATVASLRLDAVVAEGFKLSRTMAADNIEAGKVTLAFEECTNPSERVTEGSVISLRGKGRIILEKVGGVSKKNRSFITIKRLL